MVPISGRSITISDIVARSSDDAVFDMVLETVASIVAARLYSALDVMKIPSKIGEVRLT
jgi:hypothetical protein